jgi:hypothetical protein
VPALGVLVELAAPELVDPPAPELADPLVFGDVDPWVPEGADPCELAPLDPWLPELADPVVLAPLDPWLLEVADPGVLAPVDPGLLEVLVPFECPDALGMDELLHAPRAMAITIVEHPRETLLKVIQRMRGERRDWDALMHSSAR